VIAGPPLALVGLPGVGKTTVAAIVAEMLDVPLVDIDSQFEKLFKLTIAGCFSGRGEDFFRESESHLLLAALSGVSSIVSTGGGIVLASLNRSLLRRKSFCIYLHDTPDAIFERIGCLGSRPIFNSVDALNKLGSLYLSRHPLYIESAHETLDVNGLSALLVAEKAVSLYKNDRTDF
jgi:shikimate kinase